MFFLWTGVMAGILLAYLVMRYANWSANQNANRTLVSSLQALSGYPRWWLAAVVALLLVIPVAMEFVELDEWGLLEAFETVLLPWLAGVGFGIWIYLTIGSLRNPQSAPVVQPPGGGQGADQGEAVAQQPAPAMQPPARGQDAAPRSLVPIAIAMLAVAFMITDQQYGWLERLQKFSFAGGGLEFAPPPTRSAAGQQEATPGPQADGGGVIGEDRVSALVDFMAYLDAIIERDKVYLHELGDETHDAVLTEDQTFAKNVVVPLATQLRIFHASHRYNNLGLLIVRDSVDTIRSYARYARYHDMTPETRQWLAQRAWAAIKAVWDKTCEREREERLLDLNVVKDEDRRRVESCDQEARSADDWLSSQRPAPGFNPELPYGTLFAAMLLNAADEQDSAIKDLDEWVADNLSADIDHPGESWLAFRVVNQAMLLLLDDSSTSHSYLALEHSRELAKIGQKLLESDAMPVIKSHAQPKAPSTPLSWRSQSARFDQAEPERGSCPSGLTQSFKRAKLATLQASNNVAFLLSDHIEYAERQGLIPEMERRANDLATKVNTRCLAVGEDPDVYTNLERLQATFFDTAAIVQRTLLAREKDRKTTTEPLTFAGREKMQKARHDRLCKAYNYAKTAITLQANTLTREGSSFSAGPGRVAFMEKWADHRRESMARSRLAVYDRHLEEINLQFGSLNDDCL